MNLFETICFAIIVGFCLLTMMSIAVDRKQRKETIKDMERVERAISIIHEAAETDNLEAYVNAVNFVNTMLKERM